MLPLELEQKIETARLDRSSVINLNGENLTSLPESIGNLSSLETLELRGNQLETLPKSIGNLSKLETLDLRGNNIISLPTSIGSLSSLRSLRLSWDSLFSVDLSNLKSLSIECIQFGGFDLPQKYWTTHPSQWKSKWLLT